MKKIYLLAIILFLLFNGELFSMAAPATHTIGTGNLSTCTGSVFDTGDSAGDYSDGEDITETYCSNAGNCINVAFNSFSTESCCDYLRIYDGPTTGSPLVGQYQGTPAIGTINSSSGCLTFEFHSDGSVTGAGWDAALSCSPCPTCVDPSGLGVSNILFNGADLSWTENGTATQWDIEYGTVGFTPTGTPSVNNTTNNPHSLTGLSSSTSYEFYVRADCGGALTSGWVGPFNFTTIAQPSGSSCGDPHVLAALPYNNTGMTTNGYGDDYNPGDISCNTSYIGGDDYVFEYTPASCEEVSITLSNTGTYTGVFIFAGCPNAGGTCVASDGQSGGNPSLSNITLSGGITYYFIISTFPSPQFTAFDINVTKTVVSCPGDAPCSAIGVAVGCSGTKVIGNNTSLTNSGIAAPSCGSYAGSDVWFSLVVPASGIVKIENYAVTLTDVGMSVYSTSGGCGGALTEISCDDNSGFGNMSKISLTGQTAGATLYIRVWDNGNNETGTFELDAADLSSDYCVTGDGTDMGSGCAELTDAVNDELGSIWDADDKLDFTTSWSYDFTVNLGTSDAGADGVCFVIQNDPSALTATGTSGGSMGSGGITNSLIVEIDTYLNTEDRNDGIGTVLCSGGPDPDHMDIWLNGDVNPGSDAGCPGPAGTRYITNGVRLMNGGADYNIENGLDHILRVSYNSGTQTLTATTLNAAGTTTYGTVSYSPLDPLVVFGTNAPYFGFTASTGGLNNNQSACLPGSLVLPVELLSFNANCLNGEVFLQWATASEINNDYFTIERSQDGINFEKIGNVIGAGNSNNLKNYSFVDRNLLLGANYYRLKQTDFDGEFSYSELKTASCNESIQFGVYPNPASSTVTLSFNAEANIQYQIISLDGRVIEDGNFIRNKNLDLSKLSNGVYFVRAYSANEIFQEKLIKQ